MVPDNIPLSPLCRWLLFSKLSQSTFPGLGSLSSSAASTGSVGKSSRPLEYDTRALACWFVPALSNAQQASMGVLHLSGSWCTSSGSLEGTGTGCLEHLHLSIYFFSNALPRIRPTISCWVGGTRITASSKDRGPLLYFPSGDAIGFQLQDCLTLLVQDT